MFTRESNYSLTRKKDTAIRRGFSLSGSGVEDQISGNYNIQVFIIYSRSPMSESLQKGKFMLLLIIVGR